jgi:hypothetical protein
MIDIKMIIKLVRTRDKGYRSVNDSHEQIVNHTMYNLAIADVIKLLEGVDNGTISHEELKQLTGD